MLITLAGPNQFAKLRELPKLIGGRTRVDIYSEDGLAPWFERLGQADLFGESASLIGHGLCENLPKSDQERLAEHLISQDVVGATQAVIVIADDEKKLTSSPLQTVLKLGKIVQFPQPTVAKLQLWVQLEAERFGLAIAKPLAADLIARLGNDQFAIHTELERWSALQPIEITREMIMEIPAIGSDLDNFVLLGSWVDKKQGLALQQLTTLRRQGVADQVIIGSLAWKVEALLRQAYSGKSGKRTVVELEHAMSQLYKLDLQGKTGQVEFATGLELWLVETTL